MSRLDDAVVSMPTDKNALLTNAVLNTYQTVAEVADEVTVMPKDTGYGLKYRGSRMQPLTRGPEDSETAASAVHPPHTRLCTA